MEEAIQKLVDGAYRAALDDSLWADWAWDAARLLGGVCGTLNVVEAPGRIIHQTFAHENIQAVERYVDENIARFDPQILHVAGLGASCVYTDTDHADRTDTNTAEYFAWQASNGKLNHYVTAVARLNGGTHCAGLSIHRHVHDGATSEQSRRIMHRILPDIERSFELGFLHAEKLSAAYWDGILIQRSEPALLLDEYGRILRFTPAMERLLAAGDGIGCAQGHLTAARGASPFDLDRFVAALVAGEPAPQTVRLQRPSGKSPYIVTGYPLPRSARVLAPLEAAALVTIVDPAFFAVSTTQQWRAAFRLTMREAELARMLLEGHSLESASESLDIAIGTARVHLRNLFAKTDTNRQGDLIRLLTRLAG
ncbi:helix-turn-helix transcriptional regulator [Sphingomonas sp.]|jgi:DNA-binding CsgD family transcriptional regulator|uniref:helix-turn-helix transcriptional regulator n=1 Tax=Sphingomonas sp. TaxID=28214 RepID=UPI0035C82BAD